MFTLLGLVGEPLGGDIAVVFHWLVSYWPLAQARARFKKLRRRRAADIAAHVTV